jgi:hypothetical protein
MYVKSETSRKIAMAHQNAVVEPFVKNTAAAIIRRDSDTAWDSAVEKITPPRPRPSHEYAPLSPSEELCCCPLCENNCENSVVDSTKHFKRFVNALTRESKKPELNTFRWGQGSTISDVQREANAALAAYEERGNNLKKHFFHTLGRNFSNNASAAEVLLDFLPSGGYTSILCGALTLVFRVRQLSLSFCGNNLS